jgi:hypothetical protein
VRRTERSKPVDVSKGLFMDLAFILIAALVLMVNEPTQEAAAEERQRQRVISDEILKRIGEMELRSVVAQRIIENAVAGESLFIEINDNGVWKELLVSGESIDIAPGSLRRRVAQMSDAGERVVVLLPGKDVPYRAVAEAREELESLRENNTISRIVEIVSKGDS